MVEIALQRLRSQRLTGERFATAVDTVRWLTAVQAQDYAGAKWALALRTHGLSDTDVDRLLDDGAILRTHVLRPTWHFVVPQDIRWMLELTAPRVKAAMKSIDRRHEVDDAVLGRSYRALEAVLEGGRSLTRTELSDALEASGIDARGQRLGHVVMHAELDGLLTSGRRKSKQPTYALLGERVPPCRHRDREEALAELARRYFTSHGPAQVQDFAWWSGLSASDAKLGVHLAGPELQRSDISTVSYWSSDGGGDMSPAQDATMHLLPNFDEFLVAYRDRTASLDADRPLDLSTFSLGSILSNVVVRSGKVLCGWRRRQANRSVTLDVGPLPRLSDSERTALERALAGFQTFIRVPVKINLVQDPSTRAPNGFEGAEKHGVPGE